MFRMKWLTLLLVVTMSPPLLAQRGAPTTGPDSAALWGVIFRAAVDSGLRTSYPAARPRLVCVAFHRSVRADGTVEALSDPPAGVIATLAQIDSLIVRPVSACRLEPLGDGLSEIPLMVDALTRKRGIRVSASSPQFAPNGSFTVLLGYYEHGLSSAGWTCTGRRGRVTWEITTCRMDWIS